MERLNNRLTKNVIMIVLISGLTVAMLFTSGIVGKHGRMQGPPKFSGQQGGGRMQGPPNRNGGPQGRQNGGNGGPQGQPTDQQNEDTDTDPIATVSQQDQQSESDNDTQIRQADQQNAQGQPPQQGGQQDGQQNGGNGGPQGRMPQDGQLNQQGPQGQFGSRKDRPVRGGVSTGMKVLTGAEAFAIAILAAYLIMSGFNKRSFKETLPDRKKAAVFAAAAIIAGSGLTAAMVLIPGSLGKTPGGAPQLEQSQSGGSSGSDQNSQPGQGAPDGQQQSSQQVEASGAETVDGKTKTLSDSYSSSTENESVILVTNGGKLTSDGALIDKKSGDGSDTDSCDFHGVNAGLLVNEGSSATVKNTTIKTAADKSNGVFCTGSGSSIKISNSTVTTTGKSSGRGLDATNGGTITADVMTITTQGGSCAALATDRGGGTVTVSGSDLETNGAGSPLIYSTGDISISKTSGAANGSQIAVVEGKNSAKITNSDVKASAAGNRGDTDVCGVMIYQSMSGDADEGTGSFTAENSSLSIIKTSSYYKTAPMFFVTNTDAEIDLTSTKLSFGSGVLLSVKGTSEWGTSGENGGTVKLTAKDQNLEGDIEADNISEVDISLEDGSTYKGTINGDKTAKSVTLSISKDSKVTLTGDTYVTALENEDEDNSNINFNGYKLYVNGKEVK